MVCLKCVSISSQNRKEEISRHVGSDNLRKIEKKEVPKNRENQPVKKDWDLFTYLQLKAGLRPSLISKKFNIPKQTLDYRLSSLKQRNLIKKVGYGTYEIIAEYSKRSPKKPRKSTRVANVTPLHLKSKIGTSFKPDSVRGHAFQFKLQLPKNLRNWGKRELILEKQGIPFKHISLFGGAQSLNFKGNKIWLTNKSIIIYEKESFISELAKETKSQAINHFLKIINRLERHLRANFSTYGKYRFKVTRQHYSLIRNALAKQYNASGEKLNIYNDKGLWLLIDNSYNLDELETVHPKTGVPDNEKVQNFFNGIKGVEEYTPQFVVTSIAQNSEKLGLLMKEQVVYAQNIKSHIEAIKDLGSGVKKLVSLVERIER